MNEHNEEKIIEQMKESLDFLDRAVSVSLPDINHFRNMVAQRENKKQEKAKKEAIVFAAVAVGILAVEMVAFNQSILYFLIIQSFAMVAFVVGGLSRFMFLRRKVKTI